MESKSMIRENEYVEIVDHYDNLMTSGYYNHEALADSLHRLLGDRRRVLDMGVGTGLLSEKMLELADYEIVGVDFSNRMLDIARERLSNFDVDLVCEDIMEFETEDKFEAIVSTGGAFSIVEEDEEYRICSHITDVAKNEELIGKLYAQLEENGLLAVAIQGPHVSFRREIKDNVFYEQRVTRDGPYADKFYTFSDAQGQVLSEQFCRLLYFDGAQTDKVLREAGFSDGAQVVDEKFLVSTK